MAKCNELTPLPFKWLTCTHTTVSGCVLRSFGSNSKMQRPRLKSQFFQITRPKQTAQSVCGTRGSNV